MPENRRDVFLFFLSALVLAFVLGFVVRERSWFPTEHLHRAAHEASRFHSPPPYTVTRVYQRSGVRNSRPRQIGDGFTLIATFWPDYGWGQGLKLLDQSGRVVHEWQVSVQQIFEAEESAGPMMFGRIWDNLALEERNLHGTYLFPNGDVLVNVEYMGTVRLDGCGDTVWTINEMSHHSLERAEDGTFWISAGSRLFPTGSRLPRTVPGVNGPIFHDRILQLTENGEILRDIHLLEVLFANDLEHLLFRAGFSTSAENGDLTHLNDVEPLNSEMEAAFPEFQAGDLLVSLRNVNLLLVLDPETLEVKWHTTEPFLGQHDADYLPSGWIGIFDNRSDFTRRGSFLGGSRIVAVRPGFDSTKVLYPSDRSDAFYTRHMGKWQKLDNGNLLLTESQAGRVVEVTPEGDVVWEWIHEPYEESYVAEVAEGTRYQLSRERVGSWPCSRDASDESTDKQEEIAQ